MRQVTAILLLLALAFPFTMRLGIVGHYLINKTYYATVLCENKDNAALDCEGSCRLNDELNEVEKPTTNGKEMPLRQQLKISVFILINCFQVAVPPSDCTELHDLEAPLSVATCNSDFFQPPEDVMYS